MSFDGIYIRNRGEMVPGRHWGKIGGSPKHHQGWLGALGNLSPREFVALATTAD